VSEVDAAVEQLAHGDDGHCRSPVLRTPAGALAVVIGRGGDQILVPSDSAAPFCADPRSVTIEDPCEWRPMAVRR
jgi:hypothetical protein